MKTLTFTTLLALFATSAFASQKSQLALKIESQTGKTDETTVFFQSGVNTAFISTEDVQKVYPAPGIPVIYSLSSDMVDCSLNGFSSLSNTEVIALGCDVDASGSYALSASWFDNVAPTCVVRLEDRQAGLFTDLRSNVYTAQIGAADAVTGRFYLHITKPAVVSSTNAGCSNNDGVIHVNIDNSVAWDAVKLLDMFNNQVGAYNNASGQFDFIALPEGSYYIVYILGNYNTSEEFQITSHYVTTDFNASSLNVAVGESITFNGTSTNANEYNWDFGDGTLITGVVNPTISYYEPGTYTVSLLCSNDRGCSDIAQKTINVSSTVSGINEETEEKLVVFANGNTIHVNMNGVELKDAQWNVYNLIGQSVYSSQINNQNTSATVNAAKGYYLVAVKNADALVTKRVFVGN